MGWVADEKEPDNVMDFLRLEVRVDGRAEPEEKEV